MHDCHTIRKFEGRLLQLGCSIPQVRRHVRELADHYEDLKFTAMEEGLSEAEAARQADEQLGEPVALAEHAMAMLRQSSWFGRHPFIGFCLLPPAAIFLFSFCVPCLVLDFLKSFFDGPLWSVLADGGPGFRYLQGTLSLAYYGSIVFGVILFCSLARRSGLGLKWVLLVCAICSLQGYFGKLIIRPHAITIGYGPYPNWFYAAVPLLIAIGTLAWQRWIENRLVHVTGQKTRSAAVLLSCAVAVLLTGCASNKRDKPPQVRGWIGGEYKVARKWSFHRQFSWNWSVVNDPAFPESALHSSRAIKLVALSTNTPAYVAGLRVNDLVLEADHQRVDRLQDFWKKIDPQKPGTLLPLKVYRDGKMTDYDVTVGRQTFRHEGLFAMCLPSFVEAWDLWPDPGFSLVFLGYQTGRNVRQDLGTHNPAVDGQWRAWLGIFEISTSKRILSQTNSPSTTVRSNEPETKL
jgi:hypothetical protein